MSSSPESKASPAAPGSADGSGTPPPGIALPAGATSPPADTSPAAAHSPAEGTSPLASALSKGGSFLAAAPSPLAVRHAREALPVLALVGRPNVGKSTLFNGLTKSREALVAPIPGVTRDRREAIVQRDGLRFRLVDTGGMPFDKAAVFGGEIEGQIRTALAGAALVWVIVDAAEGVNPYDLELARLVQTSGRPWIVIANKAEGPERLARVSEFYRLGAGHVAAVSALHRRGIGEALQVSADRVPAFRAPAQPAAPTGPQAAGGAEPELGRGIRVAFVGRPNVGKSSLVNAILGEPRFIVSEIAGTTREAVDERVEVEGELYELVDTAGLRRKARTTEYLEKLSAVNTLQALDHAEVAVLVLDASLGPVDQDSHIAGHILDRHRACVVALNKWDRVGANGRAPKDIEEDFMHALSFLNLADPVRVSALKGTGLKHLFRSIRTAHRQFTRTISTADFNRALQLITRHTPPPARGRAPTRVFYGAQTGTRPPAFRIFTNHPEQVRAEYTRFMERQLRYHFGLEGTPLRIEWSGRQGADGEAARSAAERGARPEPPAHGSGAGAALRSRGSAARSAGRAAPAAGPVPKEGGRRQPTSPPGRKSTGKLSGKAARTHGGKRGRKPGGRPR